jgi:hypothetical protein
VASPWSSHTIQPPTLSRLVLAVLVLCLSVAISFVPPSLLGLNYLPRFFFFFRRLFFLSNLKTWFACCCCCYRARCGWRFVCALLWRCSCVCACEHWTPWPTKTKGFFRLSFLLLSLTPCGTQRQTPRPLAPITPHQALSLFPAVCLLWQQLPWFGRQRLFCGAVESPAVTRLTFESTVRRSILPVRFFTTMTCPSFVTCANKLPNQHKVNFSNRFIRESGPSI